MQMAPGDQHTHQQVAKRHASVCSSYYKVDVMQHVKLEHSCCSQDGTGRCFDTRETPADGAGIQHRSWFALSQELLSKLWDSQMMRVLAVLAHGYLNECSHALEQQASVLAARHPLSTDAQGHSHLALYATPLTCRLCYPSACIMIRVLICGAKSGKRTSNMNAAAKLSLDVMSVSQAAQHQCLL